MASKIFEELQKSITPENQQFVDKNLAISRQVRHILAHHKTIKTQKDLAKALGKEPSEISKWLNGLHNIGLENITKMEAALGCDIILTDIQAKEKYAGAEGIDYKVFQRVSFRGEYSSQWDESFPTEVQSTIHLSNRKDTGREKDRSKIA
jgi:transcriptional regulator with XRE-family HTH domain